MFIYIIVTICIISIGYCFYNVYNATKVNNTENRDSIPTDSIQTITDTAPIFTRDCVSHDIKYSIKYNVNNNIQTITDTIEVEDVIPYRVGMGVGVSYRKHPQPYTVKIYNEDYIKCCIKSSFRIVGNKYFEKDLQNNFDAFVNDVLINIQNNVHGIVEFKIINE